MTDQPQSALLHHTAAVVSAHLMHNKVAPEALPQLIQSVYQALSGLGTAPETAPTRPEPAVAIRRSVFPDHIVCLEDGAKMKMLKRYIQVRFGLTPAAYRERWGLPSDYPMVAPNYAERRSALARQIGLGRKPAAELSAETEASAPEPDTVVSVPAKPRTRRKPSAAQSDA